MLALVRSPFIGPPESKPGLTCESPDPILGVKSLCIIGMLGKWF
jgi:hypothetical protein